MIRLDNVSFSYTDDKQDNEVLKDIDLTIEDGEFVCLVGHSGCGKTTLLRLLAGLQFPDSGILRINGEAVTGPRDDTAIVFQDYALFPWMTAWGNIEFALKQTHKGMSKAEAGERTRDLLESVGMEGAGSKHPYQMSGGMRQRVAIARALAMDRDILLLDEPFGALDSRIRTELQNLMETLWFSGGKGTRTAVFVTHDISEAVRMADRVIIMDHGRLIREIRVPLRHPRIIMSLEEERMMKELKLEVTEIMMNDAGGSGRSCKCGGPA